MMLNLQFAETMELTEVKLETVYGGNLVVNPGNVGGIALPIWGGGGIGPSPTELLIG